MNLNKYLAIYGAGIFFAGLMFLAKHDYLNFYQEKAQEFNTNKPVSFVQPIENKGSLSQNTLPNQSDKNLLEQLKVDIEDTKLSFPLQNEDKSTFIDVILIDKDVAYTIITPLTKSDFTAEYIRLITETNCNDEYLQPYLNAGFSFTYKFFDLHMNRILDLSTNLNHCEGLQQANTI